MGVNCFVERVRLFIINQSIVLNYPILLTLSKILDVGLLQGCVQNYTASMLKMCSTDEK